MGFSYERLLVFADELRKAKSKKMAYPLVQLINEFAWELYESKGGEREPMTPFVGPVAPKATENKFITDPTIKTRKQFDKLDAIYDAITNLDVKRARSPLWKRLKMWINSF